MRQEKSRVVEAWINQEVSDARTTRQKSATEEGKKEKE